MAKLRYCMAEESSWSQIESDANVRLSLCVVMIQIYLNWFECECSVDDPFLIDFSLCSTD